MNNLPTNFNLQPHLDYLSTKKPRLAFQAKTHSEFKSWQAEMKTELANLLGLSNREPVSVTPSKLQSIDRGRYVEEKYSLDGGEGVLTPFFLLVPKSRPPYTPVLAFHGHDPGVGFILGNYPDGETARYYNNRDNNYAQALAEAGYLVCAVEQRGLGERITDQIGDDSFPRSCRHLAFAYMLQGRTLLGERCWDSMCVISYLQTRPDVRSDVLGCTGHSGGGTTALFLTALEPRISTAVISGYFCSFQASILAMTHCECNYVPGILDLAEMGDIAALIAPRPICLLNGRHDPIFPLQGAIEQFIIVKLAYEISGHEDNCSLNIHSGEHTYDISASRSWFDHYCQPKEML